MSLLSISDAAHVAGVSRRTIQRSIQSGRLSTTTSATGDRVIDTAELLRVFGPLRHAPSDMPASMSQSVATNDAATDTLISVLREQLKQSQEEKARLLALLEVEQAARRELETRLLPAPVPRPALASKARLWILLALLVTSLAAWWWREAILGAVAGW